MKRLNPNTGLPFNRNDIREDGFIFSNYVPSRINKNGFFKERWLKPEVFNSNKQRIKNWNDDQMRTKNGHIKNIFQARKSKAKKENIPFDVSLEYLISIAPDNCPVFNIPLSWTFRTGGKAEPTSPSLDKIIPSLGYVKGNVQWLSLKANLMKQNATHEELNQFAKWVLR
jgi:hypothetical protein